MGGRKMKNYFYFLLEWAETFRALSDPQCGRLIKAMVEFEASGAVPSFEDDALLHFAWATNIMPKMKTMQEHYRETIAKRSMAGKASVAKRTSVNKSEQMLTSVNTREQNEQKPTDIDLDIDIDLDKKEKIDRKEKPVKHQYGTYNNVLLSDVELQKLQAEFPTDWQERIDNVSGYCRSHGKAYKDYLATIRNWARRDARQGNARNDVTAGYQQAMKLIGGGTP
jgi:hypothetical protein